MRHKRKNRSDFLKNEFYRPLLWENEKLHTVVHCNTLQYTATHYNTPATCFLRGHVGCQLSLQHTAAHCNALQHTATHCSTHTAHTAGARWMPGRFLQHTATHLRTLQHTATHCNTLQHTAAYCNTPAGARWSPDRFPTVCLFLLKAPRNCIL